MTSMMLPIQRTPVEVPAMDILPFHFGSIRSFIILGASAGGVRLVLNPKLM